jgi:hypothetical protein
MFKIDNARLVITDSDSLIAKLKLQLSYDNISQPQFFKLILEAYLKRDERIISIIEDFRNHKKTKRKKDRAETKKTISDFALDENEINDMFDIISKENPDL